LDVLNNISVRRWDARPSHQAYPAKREGPGEGNTFPLPGIQLSSYPPSLAMSLILITCLVLEAG